MTNTRLDAMNNNQGREGSVPPHLMAALIESANDAIVSKTLDGIITSWNKGAERVFGYTAAEAIGQPVIMLIPEERRQEEEMILGKIRAGERIDQYETVRRRKDGTLIDISLSVSPVIDIEGKVIAASKIARDITELKRAQARVQASEERYRTLFNSIDEGFCVIQMLYDEAGKAVDYRFLEFNPVFAKLTGVDAQVGATMLELVPNHDASWFEIYGQVDRTGEPVRFVNRAEALDRWFDLYAFRVGEPEEHKVAVLFTNITERKRAEQERERLFRELQAERAKLQYLFTKAPAFVAVLQGPDHIFELTNPAYMQLIGHRDVIGKPAREAVPEVNGQGYFELLDNVYRTGEAFSGRELPVQLQREPGGPLEHRLLNFVYQPMFELDGTVSGILAHGIDVTDEVRARHEAEAANRAKDEFLATLSHELRTPLNAILGWARMLNESDLDEATRRRAQQVIQRNAQVQAQLIDDILDVSRIVSGKLKLEVRPTELAAVVEAAVESVLPAAQAKDIRLQRILDTSSSLISADPDRLQQVVWNLLSNAIKFTPKGGRVQVRLERINSHIELVVTDTGTGISAPLLPYVFERFRQADSSSTRQYGGLGLGLAIVRHLVEMHGGTVEAESPGEGLGSTFTVKLPLIAVRTRELAQDDEREHPTARSDAAFEYHPELEGVHALVVDDQEDARMLVTTVLQKCGARVTAVGSAAEALTTLQELRPDVLLSDLGMPEEDGYSLIKKIRALPPERGGQTPAAALTAFARMEDRMKVLRSGFQLHVPKPVEPAELVAVVASLCSRG